MVVTCQSACIMGFLNCRASSSTIYLILDHFNDMTQSMLALNLVFHWQMTQVESTSDVIHLHNIEQ